MRHNVTLEARNDKSIGVLNGFVQVKLSGVAGYSRRRALYQRRLTGKCGTNIQIHMTRFAGKGKEDFLALPCIATREGLERNLHLIHRHSLFLPQASE